MSTYSVTLAEGTDVEESQAKVREAVRGFI